MKKNFKPSDLMKLTDFTYKQLQYWDSTKFLQASARRRNKYRTYSFLDVVLVAIVDALRAHGYSIQRLRKLLPELKALLPVEPEQLSRLVILFNKEGFLLLDARFGVQPQLSPGLSDKFFRFDTEPLYKRVNELYPTAGKPLVEILCDEPINLDPERSLS